MQIRFTIRTVFILFVVLSLGIAIPIQRAERQRQAVSLIEKFGGTVGYEKEEQYQIPVYESRPNSLINNLQYSVTEVRISFFGYNDQTKHAMKSLPWLDSIFVTGHEPDFGAAVIQEDFPNVEVYPNRSGGVRW